MSKPARAGLVPIRPGTLDRLVFAPLIAFRRSRGWKRRGLAWLYLTIALTVGILGWREASLWRLPDAPEPFDLAKYGRIELPDADNAMVAYREVFARFGDLDPGRYKVAVAAWSEVDWSAADPEVRRWAEDHRRALEAWLPANDRPDSLFVQPEDLRLETVLVEPMQALRQYVRLALLEGSRLEQEGDPAGAWRMYRAALLASRHAGRHGGTSQRMWGKAILERCRPRIDAWIARPDVTPSLLRRAIGDVEACRAMTSPASETARADYFAARAAVIDIENWWRLNDTGPYSKVHWYNQFAAARWAHRFLLREPERSARVLRLIAAGYLAQCDRPRLQRPRLRFPASTIYAHDARTPPSVRAITPDALEAWARDSIVFVLGPFNTDLQGFLDAEVGLFDHIALTMAERAFAIEHGRPARTYSELLGGYVKALPEGIGPNDPLNPGIEAGDSSAPRD